jgi:hypothetical protein
LAASIFCGKSASADHYQEVRKAAREGRDLPEPTYGWIGQILCRGNDDTEKRGIENHWAGTIEGAKQREYDQAKKKMK